MKNIIILMITLFISSLINCTKVETKPSIIEPAALSDAKVTKAGWEKDWENIIQKAKKEAKIIAYTTLSPAARIPIAEALKKEYGITFEMVAGTPIAIVPKLMAERRAGIYLADIYIGGSSPIVAMLKPAGALDRLDKLLILPEILEPNIWYKGRLPFLDAENSALTLALAPSRPIFINTSMVGPEEIKSYRDLLNPKWKRMIVMSDPTVPGQGQQWLSVFGGVLLGFDYMRELAKQEPFLMRDLRQSAEWLARGKYAISIATGWTFYDPFIEVGAPIKDIDMSEGDYLSGASSHLALINKAAHPHAAQFFINWIASKEGSSVLARSYDRQSSRMDVPTEFEGKRLKFIRKTGVNYYNAETEDFLLKTDEWAKMGREIFAPQLR